MCERWMKSFKDFLEDVGPAPTSKHSIDRIDNDGDYEPSNCRWATHIEQMGNRTGSLRVDYQGQNYSLGQLSKMLDLDYCALYKQHVRQGKPIEEAVAFVLEKPPVKRTVLTKGQLEAIKTSQKSFEQTGAEFGINRHTVSKIKSGKFTGKTLG